MNQPQQPPTIIRKWILKIPPGGSVDLPVRGNFYRVQRSSVSLELVVKSDGFPDDTLPGERGFGMSTGSRLFTKLSISQSPNDTSPRDVPYEIEILAGFKNDATTLFFSY